MQKLQMQQVLLEVCFFDALDAGLVPENADSDATQQDILVQLIRYAEDNPQVDLNEVKITDFYNKE